MVFWRISIVSSDEHGQPKNGKEKFGGGNNERT